jgi:hypothetical protein
MNQEQLKSSLVLPGQGMSIDTSCMAREDMVCSYPKIRYGFFCFSDLEQFINTNFHINIHDKFMPNSNDYSWVPPGPIEVRYHLWITLLFFSINIKLYMDLMAGRWPFSLLSTSSSNSLHFICIYGWTSKNK